MVTCQVCVLWQDSGQDLKTLLGWWLDYSCLPSNRNPTTNQWLPGRTMCASCLYHCLVGGWIVSGWVDARVTGQVNVSEFLGEWFDSCWFLGNGVHLVHWFLLFYVHVFICVSMFKKKKCL